MGTRPLPRFKGEYWKDPEFITWLSESRQWAGSLAVAADASPYWPRTGKRIYVCDGVKDEVEIDDALAVGPAVLSDGTFNIDSSGLALAEKESFWGQGRFKTKLDATKLADSSIVVDLAASCKVSGIEILGKNYTQYAIRSNGYAYALLSDIYISKMLEGIRFVDAAYFNLTQGVYILDCDKGITSAGTTNHPNGNWFLGIRIHLNNRTGGICVDWARGSGNLFLGIYAQEGSVTTTGTGISVTGEAYDNLFIKPTIENGSIGITATAARNTFLYPHFDGPATKVGTIDASTQIIYETADGGWDMGTNYLEATEMTAPGAPAANKFRLYGEDNGSGKTRLMVRFPTGAAQVIATEP